MPAARQAVEAAELAARSATARLAAERAAHSELERLGALLEEAHARLGPAQQRAALVGALADLASGAGQNTLRMRLSAFVLAARLSAVAVAASARLAKMSAGRYTLVHSDALAGAAGAAGSACSCAMPGAVSIAIRRRCPAARPSWPRSPWPSGWPMS